MSNENDLTGRVGLDTTGFKAGVSDLNAQIRSIETGFRASAAVMDNWSGTSEGLTKRTDSLSDKLQLQKQKLSLLKDEYDKVVASQGAGSSAAASLANQLYATEKTINSTQNELKKYTSKLQNLDKSAKSVDLSGLKSALSGIGSGVVTGIKAAGAAIVGIGAEAAGAITGIVKLAESINLS